MRDTIIQAFRDALSPSIDITAIYAGSNIVFENGQIEQLPWGGDDLPLATVLLPYDETWARDGEVGVQTSSAEVWVYLGGKSEQEVEAVVANLSIGLAAAHKAYRTAGGILSDLSSVT